MLIRRLVVAATLLMFTGLCSFTALAQESPEDAKRRAAMEAERKAELEKLKQLEDAARRKAGETGTGADSEVTDSLSATIIGRVADASGQAVVGAIITAVWEQAKSGGEKVGASAMSQEVGLSDEDGCFRFIFSCNLPKTADSVQVTFSARHLDHLDSEGKTFTVKRDGEVTDLALALRKAASISGRVTDAGGQPLANVTVIASERDPSLQKGRQKDASFTRRAQTDASGNYTVKGLLAGDYLLAAERPGYKHAAAVAKSGVRAGTAEQGSDLSLQIMTAIVGKLTIDQLIDFRAGSCSFYEGETCVQVCSLIVHDDKTFTIIDPPVGSFDIEIQWWRYTSVNRTAVTVTQDQHTDAGTIEVEAQLRDDLPND